jgi:hypothetical protein
MKKNVMRKGFLHLTPPKWQRTPNMGKEIICQRNGGSHDNSAWIQSQRENYTVPGFTFGSDVQITRLSMECQQLRIVQLSLKKKKKRWMEQRMTPVRTPD